MNNLPDEIIREAERLTRLARDATDPNEANAYRETREELLATHGYTARIREDPGGDVLVCYPRDWVQDGTIQFDNITDLERGIERPIARSNTDADWEEVDAHNQAIAAEIESKHGTVHGANARAFADYMGNHHVKRIEAASPTEINAFLTDYFPRNSWPSDAQRHRITESLRLVFDLMDISLSQERRRVLIDHEENSTK